MTGAPGAAFRFIADWLERLPASVEFAQGDVLEFAGIGALTVTDVCPWAAVLPDEEEELHVRLDDGRDRSQLGGPVRRWPSAGDEGEGGSPAKRAFNFHSNRPGPAGGPDGTRPVRFLASWMERLPFDASFAVGDRVRLEDVGSLCVVRVSSRANVWKESETLHLVSLDDGSRKHTSEERIDELSRQYWRNVRAKSAKWRRAV